jgi:pimeloyl-ACP methyl ester carboxylesterase
MPVRMVALISAVLLLASCSSGGAEPVERTVDIGTHRLHAVVAGEGSPVVVVDGGVGAGSEEYRPLQDRIAGETTVVTYDRAGYGASEPGPLPRDSGTVADELKALLAELDVPGPYVLIGHSLGGLNVQVYAGRYPEDTAGMVLLDPPPLGWLSGESYADLLSLAEQMTDEWQKVADRGRDSASVQERAEAAFFEMLASEHREMPGTSARLAAAISTYGDTPLRVIASGVPNPMFGEDAAGYQQYWIDQSRALAAKSSRGQFILAEDSTHRLHTEAADLVVETILSLLTEVGRSP